MMGIPVEKQRDRMDEALDVIVRLLRGETVSHQSDWFTLSEARLQMTPYTRPSMEMAVASQVSPTGASAAGKHGLGLLSIGATSSGGFNAPRLQLGHRGGARRRARRNHGPLQVAASSAPCTSPRPREGARERPLRPGEVALLLP
jgi:alkanesulfonate monooxygenase SsuD/methylene tetrahydromethanopterin reductase-like flavin-dependent oxidoreductase (luciferase family)